jgi:hypothetical protein
VQPDLASNPLSDPPPSEEPIAQPPGPGDGDAASWGRAAVPPKPSKLRQLGALHYIMMLGVAAVVVWAMVSVYLLLTV